MARRRRKERGGLQLTREEAESIGVALPEEARAIAGSLRELPLHEQVAGTLTEDDVAEALTGEVTDESREDVDEVVAYMQEEAAER